MTTLSPPRPLPPITHPGWAALLADIENVDLPDAPIVPSSVGTR